MSSRGSTRRQDVVAMRLGSVIGEEKSTERERCPVCNAHVVYFCDALGNLRSKCPDCERLAKFTTYHATRAEALGARTTVPQALVPAGAVRVKPLPPPVIGERCAHCHQVVRNRPKPPKLCRRCGQRPPRRGNRRLGRLCEPCAQARPRVKIIACAGGCGRLIPPRQGRGPRQRKCEACDPKGPIRRRYAERWREKKRRREMESPCG